MREEEKVKNKTKTSMDQKGGQERWWNRAKREERERRRSREEDEKERKRARRKEAEEKESFSQSSSSASENKRKAEDEEDWRATFEFLRDFGPYRRRAAKYEQNEEEEEDVEEEEEEEEAEEGAAATTLNGRIKVEKTEDEDSIWGCCALLFHLRLDRLGNFRETEGERAGAQQDSSKEEEAKRQMKAEKSVSPSIIFPLQWIAIVKPCRHLSRVLLAERHSAMVKPAGGVRGKFIKVEEKWQAWRAAGTGR